MRQKGFIQLSLLGYTLLGMSMIVLGLGIALKFQTARLDAKTIQHETFVADIKAAGLAAKAKVKLTEAADLAKKERSDAEHKRLLAANTLLNKRLRDNAGRSSLPEASPVTGGAETICFGRPELDAAIRRFTSGTAELIGEGTESTLGLNSAKSWAQGQ